jgi:hypothetical protein
MASTALHTRIACCCYQHMGIMDGGVDDVVLLGDWGELEGC